MRPFALLLAAACLLSACGGATSTSPDGDKAGVLGLGAPPATPPQADPSVAPREAAARAAVPGPHSRGIAPPAAHADAIVAIDGASGNVLLESNPHAHLAPASLTKIATAVVVAEAGGLSDAITVAANPDRYWLDDTTTMGLQPGDRFTVKDLLYGLLLVSGSDAADTLADHVAGDDVAFVARMNSLARRLGMHDTHFTDATGLGGLEHYSSAYDLAILSRYAMSFPALREVAGTESITVSGSRQIFLDNHNPLLGYTPGVDGIKTGFTESAGPTFSVSATRNGHQVYLVMLKAPNRAFDAIDLVEWLFANFDWGAAAESTSAAP